MHGGSRRSTAGWLALSTVAQIIVLAAVWWFAVRTARGQLLDTIAFHGTFIGWHWIAGVLDVVLNAVSLLSLLAATAIIGSIALLRGRSALAVAAILLIVGANVSTQVLKHTIERPDLGVDPSPAAPGNSLPSGHTTVAASVAVALVMVLPPRLRGWAALFGAGYAGLTGVATLSAGWHRPSDAVAALLVVGAWATAASLVLLLGGNESAEATPADRHPVARAVLIAGGLALLLVAAAAFVWADGMQAVSPAELSQRQLLLAYAGSAAGIAGTAALVTGLVLGSAHRVVPRRAG
ncbi:phosphatase PAP2 family protein [Micromonospora sp. HM5-17]|jgi:membrane-associated phospholipid phosphatase|uniref:phosphatase PAP2 family protein n=1 Tax=Micromonospora sp. HM5-17 TaxID=2487710 RepID=UPI000F460731|nr:phosphatase PAP2 family protein [Micromonospora sp. HM5-17]ROT29490.1 phosphatase PAP2 family protein [Micromonospora sp. HM5-17]